MFTSAQLQSFHTAGYVRLEQAVPAADVGSMLDEVWSILAARGLDRANPATWSDDVFAPHNGVKFVTKLQALRQVDSSPESYPCVREALDAVFTGPRRESRNWGQALVTLPLDRQQDWLVPGSVWHFDHAYPMPGRIDGVNVFLLIDDVEFGGGGTAVVRNSPLLMDRFLAEGGAVLDRVSCQNREFLNSHPWLRGLKATRRDWSVDRNRDYLEDTDVDGISARVETLHGNAGDVFVCHPALFHAPSMNVRQRPRMMRTQRIRVA